MKNSNNYRYAHISSFEDFRVERERLILKSQIIETKINYNIISIQKMFSVSNFILSLAKEVLLPKVSGILRDLLKKVDN